MLEFAAIDFETADSGRDSACAVGVVRVRGSRIVSRRYELIRPPRRKFTNTRFNHLTWDEVCAAQGFRAVWRRIRPIIDGAQFIAAHNESFDRSVLETCCEEFRVRVPNIPFRCTMRLAREVWSIRPTGLADVCEYLGLNLKQHHYALSDAEACARIMIALHHVGNLPGLKQ